MWDDRGKKVDRNRMDVDAYKVLEKQGHFKPKIAAPMWLIYVNGLLIGVVAATLVPSESMGPASDEIVTFAVTVFQFGIPAAVIAFIVLAPFTRNGDKRFHGQCMAINRCTACLYDLSAAPTEDDGCTVCPECGAAWRLSVTPGKTPTDA